MSKRTDPPGERWRTALTEISPNKILIRGYPLDEMTAVASQYYSKLPQNLETSYVLMIDPMLATGGSAVAVGIYEEPQVTLDVMEIVGRELRLVGTLGYAYEFEEALRLAASGRVDLKPLISRVVPPTELQQAFDLLVSPQAREFKVLVKR